MRRTASILCALALAACGKANAGDGDGKNPFAEHKRRVDEFATMVIEGAKGDRVKLEADAGKWIADNKAAIQENCKLVDEYQRDLQKSKMAKGYGMPPDEYMARFNTAFGDLATSIKFGQMLETFRLCSSARTL